MELTGFIYNGKSLAEFGMIPMGFSSGDEEQDIDNRLSINMIKPANSDIQMGVSFVYEEVYSPTFQIMRDPCSGMNENFSFDEINRIIAWLNRKTFRRFKPIYDGVTSNIYYMASFNVSLIKNGSNVIGFTLEMNTNAPYGFMDEVTNSYTVAANQEINVANLSDEYGAIYCDLEVKVLEAGDLLISNSLDEEYHLSVLNCQRNEKLLFSGKAKLLKSDISHETLYNDFNYKYFRLIKTEEDNINKIKFSLPCEVKIIYSPIRKVGLIL